MAKQWSNSTTARSVCFPRNGSIATDSPPHLRTPIRIASVSAAARQACSTHCLHRSPTSGSMRDSVAFGSNFRLSMASQPQILNPALPAPCANISETDSVGFNFSASLDSAVASRTTWVWERQCRCWHYWIHCAALQANPVWSWRRNRSCSIGKKRRPDLHPPSAFSTTPAHHALRPPSTSRTSTSS